MPKDTDKKILRSLAAEYMQYASLPAQDEKADMWRQLNDGSMVRPMVTIDQLPWHELNEDGTLNLTCEDVFLRQIEQDLKRAIYQMQHFPADRVLPPFITFPAAIENSDFSISINQVIKESDEKNTVVSHSYINQFETEEDLEKIQDMQLSYDESETERRAALLQDILGDIAPVRPAGIGFHAGLWDFVSQYMGVENIYYDLLDRPDFLHQIMDRMTHSIIAGIEQANALKIHNTNTNLCHCSHIYTKALLPDRTTEKEGVSKNCWSFAMAQLFSDVSPQITAEFEVPYITKIASCFGAMYYGCCEKLSDRLDIVSKIPNVRKISCSPWSDVDEFAANLPKNIIMSVKPNPAFLATDSFDEAAAVEQIKTALAAAKRHHLGIEFLLKDISTVNYQPQRLTKWNELVKKEVENW